MWILTPVHPGGETHYLLSGKEYVVGRKSCDILLPNDQSISRAHAHLAVTDQTLTLKDTSKYGTSVNGAPLTEPVSLKSGDAVTFGVFESKFSVTHEKPVVCSSCLDNDGKASLSQALSAFGGKMVSSWTEDCTHLVMSSVKVTIKTISALLCCRPIVKPEFFSELNRAAQQRKPPPKAESFVPEIDETLLIKEDVKLEVIPGRQLLFKGKTFVFLSVKQLKRLSTAVSFGGGSSHHLEEGSLPRVLLESPQSCVIDLSPATSQTLLSTSTTEWANSVKSIVKRKGLRMITESEIGLAAMYASCDNYCNPSSPLGELTFLTNVNQTIPSASLSQSVAVNETVLPGASQNVTAYVANTEASQWTGVCDETETMTVAETPEKKQNPNPPPRSNFEAQKTNTPCVVADTMCSSVNSTQNINARRAKLDYKLLGGESGEFRRQSANPKSNRGTNSLFYKQSPQKQKTASQNSPQKQSTLTAFFQSVNKKRPLEEELSAVQSEPKRRVVQAPITAQASSSSRSCNPDTAADLFRRQSESTSEEPQSKKRKDMEEEIPMEEMVSLMSMDMDCFDEPLADKNNQQPQKVLTGSTKQKQGSHSEEFESSSKRQRVHPEENGLMKQRSQVDLEKESSFQKNRSKQLPVSVKSEPPCMIDAMTSRSESSKPPQKSSAGTNKNITPFANEKSFIEDLELLQAENTQPKEEIKTRLKPVQLKQEVQESNIDEGLPQKLVLVEFRSLTIAAPPKHKPTQMHSSASAKNFKRFRKGGVSQAFAHVIGGSDLLAHSRDKNSDLDEWLKDVVEEELQKKRDESVGDDLFRYIPTKLTKRR